MITGARICKDGWKKFYRWFCECGHYTHSWPVDGKPVDLLYGLKGVVDATGSCKHCGRPYFDQTTLDLVTVLDIKWPITAHLLFEELFTPEVNQE